MFQWFNAMTEARMMQLKNEKITSVIASHKR